MFLSPLSSHFSRQLFARHHSSVGTLVAVTLCATMAAACGDDDPVGVEPRGSIEVLTTTTGERLDTDGYILTVDESTLPELNWEVGTQDQLVLRDLLAGPHLVELRDVAQNCSVTTENPARAEVSASSTTTSSFEIECAAAIGAIRFNTITTGEDVDLTGYTATIDATQTVDLPTNGTVKVDDVTATNHVVAVSDIAPNCSLANTNPLEVWVEEDQVLDVQFQFQCQLTTGSLQVTTLTLGDELDPDGYVAEVVNHGSSPIANYGLTSFERLLAGNWEVGLSDVAPNCIPQDQNPRIVFVSVGATAEVEFQVTCLGGGGLSDQIVFEAYHDDGEGELYVVGTDGSGLTRLTNRPGYEDRAPDVGPDGTQIVLMGDHLEIHRIGWNGTPRQSLTEAFPCCSDKPAWAPDGTRIAYHSDRDQRSEIYVTDVTGIGHTRLTVSPGLDLWPAWSPDGTRIAFMSTRSGDAEIWVMNADGSNPIQLTNEPGYDSEPAWSSDDRIAFVSDRDGHQEIYAMNADGTGLVNLTNDPAHDETPAWSRDAGRLAFARDGSIWVMDADGSNQVHLTPGLTSTVHPSWSP